MASSQSMTWSIDPLIDRFVIPLKLPFQPQFLSRKRPFPQTSRPPLVYVPLLLLIILWCSHPVDAYDLGCANPIAQCCLPERNERLRTAEFLKLKYNTRTAGGLAGLAIGDFDRRFPCGLLAHGLYARFDRSDVDKILRLSATCDSLTQLAKMETKLWAEEMNEGEKSNWLGRLISAQTRQAILFQYHELVNGVACDTNISLIDRVMFKQLRAGAIPIKPNSSHSATTSGPHSTLASQPEVGSTMTNKNDPPPADTPSDSASSDVAKEKIAAQKNAVAKEFIQKREAINKEKNQQAMTRHDAAVERGRQESKEDEPSWNGNRAIENMKQNDELPHENTDFTNPSLKRSESLQTIQTLKQIKADRSTVAISAPAAGDSSRLSIEQLMCSSDDPYSFRPSWCSNPTMVYRPATDPQGPWGTRVF